jgi:hypothetical protein
MNSHGAEASPPIQTSSPSTVSRSRNPIATRMPATSSTTRTMRSQILPLPMPVTPSAAG